MNKGYDNNNFNAITNKETLAIELELSNKTLVTLATIYCPDGKPAANCLDKVILLRDFNLKGKVFNFAKPSASGPVIKDIVKELKLAYRSNEEHTHLDTCHGTAEILDMTFVTLSLKSQDYASASHWAMNHLHI